MSDLLGFGHCCADYLSILKPFPSKGKKGDVVQSLTIGGGPVPTACQTVSLFGRSARFVGKVGDDHDGKLVIDGLSACRVECRNMIVDPAISTPRANIWIDPTDGSRTVALDLTRFEFPSADEFDLQLLSDVRMLLVDGRAGEACLKGLQEARRRGVITMLDAGAVRPLIMQMLPLLNYAVVSSDFADTFSPGLGAEALAQKLIDFGTTVSVVTAGESGAYWSTGKERGFVKGFHVENVIDTTGAGDVFHGALIFGILEGWELPKSIRFANAAAALSTRKLSGRGGIPLLEEVFRLVDSND